MIIRGTPKDINIYYIADNDIAFKLQQAGLIPVYIDYDATYFKKNKKLEKVLKKLGIEY